MVQVIEAVYENGLLRPLEKLDLPESQRLRVTIEPLNDGSKSATPSQAYPLLNLRVATGISDLAEHVDEYRFRKRQP